jgi:ferric-dicitrate binding protein FerR (iron transport regulator)
MATLHLAVYPLHLEGIMKYQYIGQQTVAELADGKRVLLFTGSVILVQVLSVQLKALLERGLLKLIA